MIAQVTEYSDTDYLYGILWVKDVSEEEVQEKINTIKNKFHEEGFFDWTIDDVFAKFPDTWEWIYYNDSGILRI